MRTYQQLCGLSRSLDVVGGRWTLLVVRELLLGPKRFGELRAALPGIASNLLAQRLRELEEHGLLQRGSVPAAPEIPRYELTERGHALEEVVYALMRWGAEYMAPQPGDMFRPEWLTLVLRAYLPARVGRDTRVRARIQVGTAAMRLDSTSGAVRVAPETGTETAAEPAPADVALEADPFALLAVASGSERFASARRRGALRVHGSREMVARLERHFAAITPR